MNRLYNLIGWTDFTGTVNIKLNFEPNMQFWQEQQMARKQSHISGAGTAADHGDAEYEQ